jgi:hypothetical protein
MSESVSMQRWDLDALLTMLKPVVYQGQRPFGITVL